MVGAVLAGFLELAFFMAWESALFRAGLGESAFSMAGFLESAIS